ncbi:hypothetical protein IAR50_007234 [Cryptococcus sp. DSM 104548]
MQALSASISHITSPYAASLRDLNPTLSTKQTTQMVKEYLEDLMSGVPEAGKFTFIDEPEEDDGESSRRREAEEREAGEPDTGEGGLWTDEQRMGGMQFSALVTRRTLVGEPEEPAGPLVK